MKLLNKITLWFIGIVFLVTPVSMYISYNNIKQRIDALELKHLQGDLSVIRSGQILDGMLNAVVWKMLLIILAVSVTARLLSRNLFSPFRQTMKVINNFNLKQKQKIQLPETNIKEFKELNIFLKKMTDKAMEDYASVKEFSENASHELQTPLAVLRSKLELMTETNISEDQAALIEDMQNAIEKLSRINRSLTTLTRLENHEFETSEYLRFCRVTKEILAAYADRITLKNIEVTSKMDKNIMLKIHPALAEMLISNLLSNSIRHNINGGSIRIDLTREEFCISNTGCAPEIPTEELFQRFKKSNQSDDSIGLGLAIVKQICEVSNFIVNYQYSTGWHTVRVGFNNAEAVTLPNVTGTDKRPFAIQD